MVFMVCINVFIAIITNYYNKVTVSARAAVGRGHFGGGRG